MDWARSRWMRAIALAASVALVLIHWDEQGTWFWVGVVLVALNLRGLLTIRSRAAASGERVSGPQSTGDRRLGRQREDEQAHRLQELLSLPGVAAAFATGPQQWRQVSYLGDAHFEPIPVAELAAFIWIENHQGWVIGLGDEAKPYLDLDIDERDDPLIRVLEAHPAVVQAIHEDREVYRIEQRRPISAEEFAELAARALVSHHVHAAARS